MRLKLQLNRVGSVVKLKQPSCFSCKCGLLKELRLPMLFLTLVAGAMVELLVSVLYTQLLSLPTVSGRLEFPKALPF